MQNKEEIKKLNILSAFNNDFPFLAGSRLKSQAFDFYKNNQFPNLKDEGWRQTNLSSIFNTDYKEQKASGISLKNEFYNIENLQANTLVFINGFYAEEYSIIISKNLIVGSIQNLTKKQKELFNRYFESTGVLSENNFTALNTAFAHDGAFIYVDKNQQITEPVHIVNINSSGESILAQTRNLVVVERNSSVQIIESYLSENIKNTFTNVVTEIIAGENAQINWIRIQKEAENAKQMNHLKVIQNANSNFSCNTITLSGTLVRNNIHVNMNGEGSFCNLYGLYLTGNKQLVDNYTFVNHAVPHCESRQVYKGIIDDEASAVFFGKVLVAKDAQKTNANQSNKNILLSENARINSKPQLEIYADDVTCSHGSTTGQLDKEALFYLQSRGISKEKARGMLLYGFVSEILNKIENENVRNEVDKWVKHILGE
ncbi:MAG: Fe-S cluster assembly protein SufD [Chlorobi bacterium]|nr:Fe-S cluster assembly protein SufD [Chlorobiota bacterium]